jgi:protein involved in polysaccharide export with SLBB domain
MSTTPQPGPPQRRRSLLERPGGGFIIMMVVFSGGLLAGAVAARLFPPKDKGSAPPPVRASATNASQGLKVGDKVEIVFEDRANPGIEKVSQATVEENGGVRLPLVGGVIAQGMTPEELGRAIAQLYRERNIMPDLKVVVRRVGWAAAATTAPATREGKANR